MSDRNPEAAAQQPADAPRVQWIAVIVAVLLLALSFVAAREFILTYGGPQGWAPWIRPLPEKVTSLDPEWVGILGLVTALVGLGMVVAALSPRRRRYRPVAAGEASVWVRPVDVARVATASAKRVPGVVSASSLVRRNRLSVNAVAVNSDEATRALIEDSLKRDVSSAFGDGYTVNVGVREAEVGEVAASRPVRKVS